MKSIVVRPTNAHATAGKLTYKDRAFLCALGRSGVIPASDKREGDGATPAGRYPLRRVWIRKDKFPEGMPRCEGLEVRITSVLDGWSDDANSANYNRPIVLTFDEAGKDVTKESHERLWHEDDLYDVVVEIGYNDNPPVPGKGSAIFMHVAREKMTPTDGCIALQKSDLVDLIGMIEPGITIQIELD